MTMCVRRKPVTVAASSSSTERVCGEQHRVDEINLSEIFFFLHCRASTRHCRSTTGNTQKRVTPWNKHAKSSCKRTVPFGNKAVKPQKLHSSG